MIHIILWPLIAWNVAIVTIGIVKKQAHRIYIYSGLLLFFAAVGFMPYWEAPSVVWKTGLVISATASIPFVPASMGGLITKLGKWWAPLSYMERAFTVSAAP